MNQDNERLNALLSLLQDENLKVASLAMEQFLKLGQLAEKTIAEHQESSDPQLRCRIHQLSSILARRRARQRFIQAVGSEDISVWDGVCQINALYDPAFKLKAVVKGVRALSAELGRGTASSAGIAALMRSHDFAVPSDDLLDVDLYLVESVLESKYGSPPLLCALAAEIGRLRGWSATVVLHEGKFCLMDEHNLLIDPAAGWRMTYLKSADRVHPCGRKDLWFGILAQLFLVTLIEGHLRDLYHFGDLLTALNGMSLEELPYPLGELAADTLVEG